jgi:hypothetical protein
MKAKVGVPHYNRPSTDLTFDGEKVKGQVRDRYLFVDGVGSGSHTLICK